MSVADLDIALVAADPRRDAAVLHAWLSDPHAAFWGMGGLDRAAIVDYLDGVLAHPAQQAWLGLVDGAPTFYAETYDPLRVLLAGVRDLAQGDLGMHVLISPPAGEPRHGLTDAVFATVMAWCFSALEAERVVVEPDVRNGRIRRKNARAGFAELREVTVADGGHAKTAMLSVCTRASFAASELSCLIRREGGRA